MPTERGIALFGLGSGLALSGWVLGVEEFLLAALSAATLLVWGAASVHLQARRATRALVTRADEPRQEVSVGDEVSISVRLRNTARRSLSLLVYEELESWAVSYPGLLGSRVVRTMTGVAGAPSRLRAVPAARTRRARWRDIGALQDGAECVLRVPIPTTQRGLWSQPGVRVWCMDPLGLMATPVGQAPGTEVVVVPRPGPGPAGAAGVRGAGAPQRRGGDADAEGSVAPGGDEFAGLRPYVPGDRLTRLHWQALARTGDLLVRDFVDPIEELAEVVVDDERARLEASVLEAAATGSALLRGGTGLVVRTVGGDRLVVPPGPAAQAILLRALATVGART